MQLPQYSWLFTVDHHDISGKVQEHMVVLLVMLLLLSSFKYAYQLIKPTEMLMILLSYCHLF